MDENISNMEEDEDDDDADDENQMDEEDEREVSSHVQLIKNRIATSTPRGDALSLDQRQHSNLSLAKQLASNYQNSSQSPNFGSLNDDINLNGARLLNSQSKLNSNSKTNGATILPEIHVSLLSTSLSTNDRESDDHQDGAGDCGDDEADRVEMAGAQEAECSSSQQCTLRYTKKKISKKHLMSKKLKRQSTTTTNHQDCQESTDGSLPRRSADIFSNDGGGINSSSNLVISSSSSASFGAINLNNNAMADANDDSAHPFKLNGKQIDDLIENKIDESITNFTSIEKLSILKPQSKDYILCFDTSSIDQNSSFASIDYNQQVLSACVANSTAVPVVKRDHKKSINLNELINDLDLEHRTEEDFGNNDVQSFNHSLSNSSSNGEHDPHKLMMTSKSSTNTDNTSGSNMNGSSQNLNYEMLMSGNYDKELVNCPT